MEFSFSSKEEGLGLWAAPVSGVQMDSSDHIDNGVRIPVLDDPFGNFADLINFYVAGLYNNGLGSDQIFSSYMLPNCTPAPYESLDALNFPYQDSPAFSDRFGPLGSSYVFGDKSNLQPASTQITYPIDFNNGNDDPRQNEDSAFVPRSFGPLLEEKKLMALSLSCTMQGICRSLRTVSDAELGGEEGSKTRLLETTVPTSARKRSPDAVVSSNCMNCIDSRQIADWLNSDGPSEQIANGSRRRQQKKKSTSEKTVSLSVLQQYFSDSLKDAAKCIGVCPTTLKRICRQHGISRWPSRKISKVNRSLRKIQTVLDSVHGVEVGLKFDPDTCGFVSAGGASHSLDIQKPFVFSENISALRSPDSLPQERNINDENFANKDAAMGEVKKPGTTLESGSDPMELMGHNGVIYSSMMDSSNGSGLIMHGSSSSSQSFEEGKMASKPEFNCVDSGSKITVKANYWDEMVGFKFEPSYGWFQLYEEVAKRFRIQNGMFQVKYLDDEEEWVMLAGDSDLQECLEIMEGSGMRSVKFMVRDSPLTMGSTGSSSCFLMGGS